MREARKVATAGCVKTQWEKATGLREESITTERGREIRRRPMGVVDLLIDFPGYLLSLSSHYCTTQTPSSLIFFYSFSHTTVYPLSFKYYCAVVYRSSKHRLLAR